MFYILQLMKSHVKIDQMFHQKPKRLPVYNKEDWNHESIIQSVYWWLTDLLTDVQAAFILNMWTADRCDLRPRSSRSLFSRSATTRDDGGVENKLKPETTRQVGKKKKSSTRNSNQSFSASTTKKQKIEIKTLKKSVRKLECVFF